MKIDNRELCKSGYRQGDISFKIESYKLVKNTCRVKRSGAINRFDQRVGLGNSYCNCFHLMCRVKKSSWYIFKKESCSRHTLSCSAPINTWKYSDLKTLSFSTRLHEIFPCVWLRIICCSFSCVITGLYASIVCIKNEPVLQLHHPQRVVSNNQLHFLSCSFFCGVMQYSIYFVGIIKSHIRELEQQLQ